MLLEQSPVQALVLLSAGARFPIVEDRRLFLSCYANFPSCYGPAPRLFLPILAQYGFI
jgi:hypothetical protein